MLMCLCEHEMRGQRCSRGGAESRSDDKYMQTFVDSASTPSSFQHQTLLNPFHRQKKQTTHPILVVKHDRVCCGEVDAEPTHMRAQKEELWGIRLVTASLETIHLHAV